MRNPHEIPEETCFFCEAGWLALSQCLSLATRNSLGATVAIVFLSMLSCNSRPVVENSPGPISDEQKSLCDQKTPALVLKKVHLATLHADREAFAACYRCPKGAETLLERYCDLQAERYKFLLQVEKAYGSEGFARFVDFRTMKAPGMTNINAPPLHESWWDKVEFKVRGNEAEYGDPTTGLFAKRQMVCDGNVWRIKFDLPEPFDVQVKLFDSLIAALRIIEPSIGRPGITIDDLRLQLGQLQAKSVNEVFGGR
jgi:hypothetical protein